MRVLDLYCGAGGASTGLQRAGFDVTGIDMDEQPEYPYEFIRGDALKADVSEFNLVWASPPCQNYSIGTKGFRNNGKKYPDLIEPTRKMLLKSGKPFVIENVPGAPIRHDLMLCGCMFNLRVFKRRYFELQGCEVWQPIHKKHIGGVCTGEYVCTSTACVNPGCFGKRTEFKKKYGLVWKNNNLIKSWQNALGIDWITDRKMLAEAIPPKYSEYIGKIVKNHLLEG